MHADTTLHYRPTRKNNAVRAGGHLLMQFNCVIPYAGRLIFLNKEWALGKNAEEQIVIEG